MGLKVRIKPQYQFTLEGNGVTCICKRPPMQWKEGISKVSRDMESAGVFNSYQVSDLTFIGNGAEFLKQLFLFKEGQFSCTLTIAEFDFKTMSYIDFPTIYSAQPDKFKTVKIGKFAIGVSVPFVDSSLLQKFIDRKKTNIDITKLNTDGTFSTIGGATLADYENKSILSRVFIPGMNSFFKANLQRKVSASDCYLSVGYNSIPLFIGNSDFGAETTDVPFQSFSDKSYILPFLTATESKTVTIKFSVTTFIQNLSLVSSEPIHLICSQVDSTGATISENTIRDFGLNTGIETYGSYNAGTNYPDEYKRTDLSELSFTLTEGDSLKLYYKRDSTTFSYDSYFLESSIEIKETTAITENAYVDGFEIYQALNRMSQMIFDDQWAFYSDFFGKMAFKWSDSDYYSAEDSQRMAMILSGLNLRGLSISQPDGKINIIPEKFLHDISAMYCIGWAIEFKGDRQRLRIENRAFFFQDIQETEMDFSTKINKYDIISEYISDMAYAEIEYGFNDDVFLSVNGRNEYCIKNTRTTQIPSDKKLDLMSDTVAATTSIVNCLMKPVSTFGTEDLKEDSKVFILKTQIDTSGPADHNWKAELPLTDTNTDALISIENNSSPYGDLSLNLFFDPARNMVRNSELFTPALRLDESNYLRHQTTDKFSGLETTGEGYTIVENQDIRISDTTILPVPRMKPIKHIVDVNFNYKDLNFILATGDDGIPNRYKLIKFTDTISGWIYGDGIMKKNMENKASITIIEKIQTLS